MGLLPNEVRYLLDVARHRWIRMVITVALVLAASVLVWSLRPRQYEATALILATGEWSQIKMEPNYQTVLDSRVLDPTSFKRTLALLAVSPQVAQQVSSAILERHGIDIGADDLLGKAKISAVEGTNLVEVTVRDETGERAAVVATTWAEVFVDYANTLFGERTGLLPALRVQLEDAKTRYNQAQQALEEFLGRQTAEEIKRQIDTKRKVLTDHYTLLSTLQTVRNRADMLQRVVASTADTTAFQSALDSLAVFDLQTPLLGVESPGLSTVQLTVDGAMSATLGEHGAAASRLAELIKTVDAQIEREIGFLNESTLYREILELSTELEKQNALLRELTQQRDAAWETYKTVGNKLSEASVLETPAGTFVRVATPGIAGNEPIGPGLIVVIVAGLVAGLLLAATDLLLASRLLSHRP